jgi:Mn-containing catalase
MTVTMQYLFQGWSCRMPGKYKDLIMGVATEEMGHVEMIATMVARLLEGAPATATTKAAAAEAQSRVQTARLYNMTDDPGVRNMLKFNLARDTLHQNLWLKAIEELQADGLESTAAPNALFDEEYAEHATSVWHLSDGTAGHEGSWAAGPQPDGLHEFGYLLDPEPLGGPGSAPAPDPKLYAACDGKQGEPFRPGPRPRNRPGRKDQGRPHLIGWGKPVVTGTAAGPPDGACGRPERRPQAPDRRKE